MAGTKSYSHPYLHDTHGLFTEHTAINTYILMHRFYLLALLVATLNPLQIRAAEPVVIVFRGDPVPNGNGTFTFLGDAVINDAGQVAFRASLAGTSGGGNDNRGIFRGDGTTLTQIARLGQPAPDGNGVLAFDFPFVSINQAGQVAFWSDVANTSGGDADDEGIFLGDGGLLKQIFRTGSNVPGSTSIFYPWDNFGTTSRFPPALNDSGQVSFWSPIDGNSSPFNSDQGIYRGDGTNLVEIARRAGTATGGGVYGHFGGAPSIHIPTVNNAGQVAFVAQVDDGTIPGKAAIFRGDGTIPPVQIYREGMPFSEFSPELGGFGNLAFDPMIDESGQIAFYSTLASPFFDAGIFLLGGANWEIVELVGSSVPADNGFFDNLALPVINDVGQVAFYADLVGTPGGANDNSGIYRHTDRPGPDLEEIARDGGTAPGGNGRFAFGATSLEYTPALNNAGQVAFFAKLTGTTGGNNDNDGIFFFDDALGLIEVAREGAPFLGSTYQSLQFKFAFASKMRESSGLNNQGQVAFKFALNDGREGIAVWTAPTPPSTAQLGITSSSSGAEITISWPAALSNWVLETSITPTVPQSWSPVTNPIVAVGQELQATIPKEGNQRFFRLRHQL